MPKSKHPTKEKGLKVQVFYIPANSNPPHVVEVGLYKYSEATLDAQSESREDLLGRVPDLSFYEDEHDFDIRNRSLFHRNSRADTGKHDECIDLYHIYKCIDGKECERNPHFDESKDTRVYKDAFIFRPSVGKTVDGEYISDYDSMIEFEDDFYTKQKGWAREIVREMGSW